MEVAKELELVGRQWLKQRCCVPKELLLLLLLLLNVGHAVAILKVALLLLLAVAGQ